MRILYHHRTRGEDAQGVHIHSLCAAFEGLGHEVKMVAPLGGQSPRPSSSRRQVDSEIANEAQQTQQPQEARPTLCGMPIPSWFYELLALAYNIPAFLVLLGQAWVRRPDMIYERYTLFSCAGWWVSRVLRRPFILEVNAPLSLELQSYGGLVFSALAQFIEDRLCAAATRTVVVSQAMADIFSARGVPRDRLLVVPNGVDAAAFNTTVDGSAVRRRYALQGCRVIGFVGWVRPWHGVDGLLRGVAQRLAADDEVRVLIVGDGPALAGLRQLAVELGIAERVIFTGAVAREEIPAYIAALDIAVQPDVTDYASPIKLFEYLALGCAVIAPDKANIREVVRHDETALLFPACDWPALGQQVEVLLEDSERRQRLARAAARLISDGGYTWQSNAQRVVDIVDLAGSQPSPAGES